MTLQDNQFKKPEKQDKVKVDEVIDESLVLNDNQSLNVEKSEEIKLLKNKISEIEKSIEDIKDILKEHKHDNITSKILETFNHIVCKRITLTDVLNLEAVSYGGGTDHPSGSPESANEPQEGWLYCRINYDVGNEDNIRVYVGSSWRSITTT